MPVGSKNASSKAERKTPGSDLEFLEEILAASGTSEPATEHPREGEDAREVDDFGRAERAGEKHHFVKDRMRDLASYLLPAASPANDDRESIGALIKAIERKHNRAPELTALAATCFWLLLCIVFIRGESARFVGGGLLSSEAIIIVLAVTGFVFAFFLLTGVAIRARDTQATVKALTKLVAVGLEDGLVVPNGRSDDGAALERLARIEKSIEASHIRAEKLGSAYQADCAKFEQAVAQSEARLKTIIEEFAVERASIVTSAEKLRFSISGSHHNLSSDLEAATAKLEKLIDSAGSRVVGEITSKTEEVTRFAHQAEEKTSTHLRALFENTLLRATERLEEVNTKFAANLSAKGVELESKLSNRLREAALVFERQAEDVEQKSCARVEDVTAQITRLLDRMNIALADRSDSLKAALAEKLMEIAQTFREGSLGLSREFEKVAGVADRLSGMTTSMNESTSDQIGRLNDEIVVPLRGISASLGVESFQFVRRYLDELASFDRKLLDRSQQASAHIDGSINEFTTKVEQAVDRIATVSDRGVKRIGAFAEKAPAREGAPRVAAPRVAIGGGAERLAAAAPSAPPAAKNEPPIDVRPRPERSLPEADARTAGATAQAADPEAERTGRAETKPLPAKSWISELLERASVDDGKHGGRVATSPAPGKTDSQTTISSLFGAADSLFLSDQRLQQAWEDFRGGKPSSFGSVYTEGGAVLKQRLREKLNGDGDLRKTIDSYTQDFENVLVKACSGADDETFLGLITMDAGKIYTILADVSGRLDISSSSLRATVSHDR